MAININGTGNRANTVKKASTEAVAKSVATKSSLPDEYVIGKKGVLDKIRTLDIGAGQAEGLKYVKERAKLVAELNGGLGVTLKTIINSYGNGMVHVDASVKSDCTESEIILNVKLSLLADSKAGMGVRSVKSVEFSGIRVPARAKIADCVGIPLMEMTAALERLGRAMDIDSISSGNEASKWCQYMYKGTCVGLEDFVYGREVSLDKNYNIALSHAGTQFKCKVMYNIALPNGQSVRTDTLCDPDMYKASSNRGNGNSGNSLPDIGAAYSFVRKEMEYITPMTAVREALNIFRAQTQAVGKQIQFDGLNLEQAKATMKISKEMSNKKSLPDEYYKDYRRGSIDVLNKEIIGRDRTLIDSWKAAGTAQSVEDLKNISNVYTDLHRGIQKTVKEVLAKHGVQAKASSNGFIDTVSGEDAILMGHKMKFRVDWGELRYGLECKDITMTVGESVALSTYSWPEIVATPIVDFYAALDRLKMVYGYKCASVDEQMQFIRYIESLSPLNKTFRCAVTNTERPHKSRLVIDFNIEYKGEEFNYDALKYAIEHVDECNENNKYGMLALEIAKTPERLIQIYLGAAKSIMPLAALNELQTVFEEQVKELGTTYLLPID